MQPDLLWWHKLTQQTKTFKSRTMEFLNVILHNLNVTILSGKVKKIVVYRTTDYIYVSNHPLYCSEINQ